MSGATASPGPKPPGRARRWLRRAGIWLRRREIHLVSSPRYDMPLPVRSVDPRRAKRVLSWLDEEGLLLRPWLHRARRATLLQLARVHDAAYLESLQHRGSTLPILGLSLDDAEQDAFLDGPGALVGGTVRASRLALRRLGIAFHLGGGLHHARADRGQGFCAFHDVAVAVSLLRRDGYAMPILVVDLDLHDGEGTRALFAGDPTVHTYSVHNRTLEEIDAVEDTAIELGAGVGTAVYLDAVRGSLPALVRRFRPGLVFFLAGADPAEDDGLGDWEIDAAGMEERDRFVVDCIRGERPVPLVALLAGGYGASAWRYPARTIARLLAGSRAPHPPETLDWDLRRHRRIAGMLRVADLTREPEDDAGWSLEPEDVLPAARKRTRLLGFYSRHGFELVLERFGIFEALRRRGYERPRVAWELDGGAGETVRVLDESAAEPLIELRVRRDRTSIAGCELLFIEWLLLQDPRAAFAARRPALPGQKHPGLGLLRDVVSMLILAAERLELDGLAFVPARYHIAAQSGRLFHFVEPELEARFHALRRALGRLPLGEAAARLESGGVVDARGGEPAGWKPGTMVVPVSAALRERFASPAYRDAVRDFDFEFAIATGPLPERRHPAGEDVAG